MNKLTKILIVLLSSLLAIAMLASCVEVTDEPDATNEPEAPTAEPVSDAPETTQVIAKVGSEPVYGSEFYYFLYQGIRELYYGAEDVYNANATDEENLANMKTFFYSEDEEGVTYLRRAADRTLEIAQGFKIAYTEGKKASSQENAKYTVDEAELADIIDYIDSEADYGASMYGMTRDDYFFYMYGMNVADAKRYTRQQVYAELHENYWADENGYVIGMDEPAAPEEPDEPAKPADDASDEDKAKYDEDLAAYNSALEQYNKDLEQYQKDLAEFESLKTAYYEKFRDEFNENKDIYSVKTVRTLLLSKVDADGEKLPEDQIEAKRKSTETYIDLVRNGHSFESVVKGFSESLTVSSDLGLVDINLYNASTGDLPEEVITYAKETETLDEIPVPVETDNAIYLVMVVGIVNYDEATGLVADASSFNVEAVRSSVEYAFLSRLYNDYVEELMQKDEYKLTDIDVEAMMALATEYLEYTVEEY